MDLIQHTAFHAALPAGEVIAEHPATERCEHCPRVTDRAGATHLVAAPEPYATGYPTTTVCGRSMLGDGFEVGTPVGATVDCAGCLPASPAAIQDHNAAACGNDHAFIDGAEGEFCFACGLTPQQAAERARGWVAFCTYCDVDRSVIMDEPGTAVCPEHRDEHRAWLAAREAAKPPRCPECYRPGPPCPERTDGRCRHCSAQASDIILSHYHPYRATND